MTRMFLAMDGIDFPAQAQGNVRCNHVQSARIPHRERVARLRADPMEDAHPMMDAMNAMDVTRAISCGDGRAAGRAFRRASVTMILRHEERATVAVEGPKDPGIRPRVRHQKR